MRTEAEIRVETDLLKSEYAKLIQNQLDGQRRYEIRRELNNLLEELLQVKRGAK